MGMRSTYEMPEISLVELRPAEAILSNCKTSGFALGPDGAGPDCEPGPPTDQCLQAGS